MTILQVLILLVIIFIPFYIFLKLKITTFTKSLQEKSTKIIHLQSTLDALRTTTIDPNEYVHKHIYKSAVSEKNEYINLIIQKLNESIEKNSALVQEIEQLSGKQKSEQVRLGQIAEQLIPFLHKFKYNPKNLKPLFQPIDYIAFEDDKIVFIEVKTGNSKLSTKQNHIKRLIESGEVYFEIHRISSEDYNVE